MRLAILGSTRGTDMLAIIAAIQNHQLSASIELVISNNQQAVILELAREHRLRAVFVDPHELTREVYDQKISLLLKQHAIDLVILVGYMRILSAIFIYAWKNKVINVHPSLLPAFAGGMDKNVHQSVLDSKVNETGCTVHMVTEEVDRGPILVQKRCAVLTGDTVDTLKARVQRLEGEALVEAIKGRIVIPPLPSPLLHQKHGGEGDY